MLLLAVGIQSCSKDDGGGITQEQRQFVMGESEGNAVFHTGFVAPLVLARDNVHSHLRELDLNSDGEIDVHIRAFQDFNGDRGLTISTVNAETRVSLDENGMIKPLENGDIVTVDSETWGSADALPLAVIEGSVESGTWNMLGRRFVALRLDIGITRNLSWIEISVEEYDNYTLYNYALKIVP